MTQKAKIAPQFLPLTQENVRPGDLYFSVNRGGVRLRPALITKVGEGEFKFRAITEYALRNQGEHVQEQTMPYGGHGGVAPSFKGFVVGVRETGLEVMLSESTLRTLGELETLKEVLMALPEGTQCVAKGKHVPYK